MENKSAVSALQEYCAQNKVGPPEYDYIAGDDGGYVCKVTLLEMEAYGNGRSKRDAKHLSALNLMRKVRKLIGEDEDGTGDASNGGGNDAIVDELTNLNRDMLKELRDYCVRHDMPLPVIEIVQQSGTPNAPEFTACCTVASIKRYGKSDKKKDARQRAAIEMLCVIANDDSRPYNMQLASNKPSAAAQTVDNSFEDAEAERRKKFKTYRELTDSGVTELRSTKLCDRHNYFKGFYPHLKTAAFEVLNSTEYDSEKEQAEAVLDALKLDHRITKLDSNTIEPLVMLEVLCDYDAVLVGRESQIHNRVLDYFRVMLV